MDVSRSVALVNLVVQVLLVLGVLIGAYLGLTHRFGRHCLLMRALMSAQILLIGIIMAPQLGRYLQVWSGFSALMATLLVHHALGLVALGLWVYINLAMAGVVKAPSRYTWFMRCALASWVASLALGGYLFWYLWR